MLCATPHQTMVVFQLAIWTVRSVFPIAALITMMSRRPPSKTCSPLAAVAHLETRVVAVSNVIRLRLCWCLNVREVVHCLLH